MGSPNSPVLKRLHSLNTSSSEFHSRLSDFLHGEEYQQCVPNLQGGDPAWLVDYLDKVCGHATLPHSLLKLKLP